MSNDSFFTDEELENMFPGGQLGTGNPYYEGIPSAEVSEMFETISEEYSTDGCSAQVTLKCPWGSRQAVIFWLLKDGQGWNNGNNTNERHVGAIYPHKHNDMAFDMELQSVSVEPFSAKGETTGNGQAMEYRYALITLQYATNKPVISYQVTSEYLTLNHAELYWWREGMETPKPVSAEQAPGILIHGHVLTIEAKRVDLSQVSLNNIEGYVNEKTIGALEFVRTYPPGTLMCNAPTLKQHAAYPTFFDVTLNFAYRETGWNTFFDPTLPGNSISEKTVSLCDVNKNVIDIFPKCSFKTLFEKVGIVITEM
ncbi:MAG: hypothetical protein Q4C70_03570 [Planctomycetia bacterium]|nr:hypothetical protein [Planctomycetia bacterium]